MVDSEESKPPATVTIPSVERLLKVMVPAALRLLSPDKLPVVPASASVSKVWVPSEILKELPAPMVVVKSPVTVDPESLYVPPDSMPPEMFPPEREPPEILAVLMVPKFVRFGDP